MLSFCNNNSNTTEVDTLNTPANNNSYIQLPEDLLNQIEPPFDVAKNSTVLDYAIFAWREIIALSWKSTYSKDQPIRATPDPSWSYEQGTPDAPFGMGDLRTSVRISTASK